MVARATSCSPLVLILGGSWPVDPGEAQPTGSWFRLLQSEVGVHDREAVVEGGTGIPAERNDGDGATEVAGKGAHGQLRAGCRSPARVCALLGVRERPRNGRVQSVAVHLSEQALSRLVHRRSHEHFFGHEHLVSEAIACGPPLGHNDPRGPAVMDF